MVYLQQPSDRYDPEQDIGAPFYGDPVLIERARKNRARQEAEKFVRGPEGVFPRGLTPEEEEDVEQRTTIALSPSQPLLPAEPEQAGTFLPSNPSPARKSLPPGPGPTPAGSRDPNPNDLTDDERDPVGFEARRMGAPPASGELRYGIGDGPMRSYNVGANRTDMAGDPDFAKTRGSGFGSTYTPTGGGTVSYPAGGNSADPAENEAAYEKYTRDLRGPIEAAAQKAEVAKQEAIAKDPTGIEAMRTKAALDVQKAGAGPAIK